LIRARAWILCAGLSVSAWTAHAWAQDDDGCAPRSRLLGIDVSSYQGAIDWKQVKKAGVVFAFARVSDGMDVIDDSFARNYREMKRTGIRRGAYQHFRASADPEDQAELLLGALRGLGRPDLPLVADVETDDGMTAAEVQDRLARWIRRIERRTKRRPIIYMSPSMSAIVGTLFGAHHLWIAHYEVECPELPAGWERWTFWQHSSAGRVAGIEGDVDLDVFAGDAADLRRLNRPFHASR
jgi:lysozyme